MSYANYYDDQEDGEEDDLQRMLEGRDQDDDAEESELNKLRDEVEKKERQQSGLKRKNQLPEESAKKSRADDGDGDEGDDDRMSDHTDEDDRVQSKHYNDAHDDDGEAEAIEVPARKKQDAVKRRITANPRPKLDVDKLMSDKGLVELPNMFDKVKLKGKGHELEDLNKVLSRLEYWAHRLFPNLSFGDFCDKCEDLGRKRNLNAFLCKIRLDLPLTTGIAEDSDQDEPTLDNEPPRRHVDAEEEFDRIFANDPDYLQYPNTVRQPNISLTEEQMQLIEAKREQAKLRRQTSQTQPNQQPDGEIRSCEGDVLSENELIELLNSQ